MIVATCSGNSPCRIYLLHPFIFRFALIGKSEFAAVPEFAARLVFFVAIATAFAWLTYKIVEVPSKAWLRQAFRSRRHRDGAVAGTAPAE
ncbi:hypothetical protein [Bradyrhizobium sp. STM 3557]|uniref:hypothetical protein n=1 Tax=Bradyrhizobium sp. STM 3557 TaxID=578920 RepID=UPI003890ED48